MNGLNADNIAKKVAKKNEADMFWLIESLEAYEASNGKIEGFPPIASFLVAMEGSQERLVAIVDDIIKDLRKDFDNSERIAKELNDHGKANAVFAIAFPPDYKKDIETAKRNLEIKEASIHLLFKGQIARSKDLLARTRKLIAAK